MVARVRTVAFHGVEVIEVDTQVTITSGLPAFTVVGLPDKAVAELRERVRAALASLGLGLPPRHITVNLAPADVVKEGSHFDLPIALGLLAAMDALPADELGALHGIGRAGARRLADRCRRCPAGGARRGRPGQRHHLPGRMRRRGGVGRRGRDRRGAEPVGHCQSLQGHPAAAAAGAALGAVAFGRARPRRRQGPGERQTRARDRRGGRSQPADDRARQGRASRCWRRASPVSCRRSNRTRRWSWGSSNRLQADCATAG